MAKKGCGCLLTLVTGFALITFAAIGGAAWYVHTTVALLGDQPKPLPLPEITEQSEARLHAIDGSLKAIFERGEAGTVSITSELLNGWLRLNENPDLRFIGDHSWITLTGERAVIDLSVPLTPINFPGRFLSGTATVSGWLREGSTRLFVHEISVDGEAGRRLNGAIRLFEGRDISATLDLPSLLKPELLQRCAITLKLSVVEVTCSQR
jgi:hypothetical protein